MIKVANVKLKVDTGSGRWQGGKEAAGKQKEGDGRVHIGVAGGKEAAER